jgi:hypothetical protein
MKKVLVISTGLIVSGLILVLLSAAPACFAQGRNFDELAHRIVTTTVNIKPGEAVVISGGKHTVPLMEALAIEAQKAGGLVTMFLGSDKVIRSFNADVPEKYLEQEPRFFAEWLRQVDVWISLPDVSDIKALDAGVPAARLAKIDKANQFLTPLLDSMKVRQVSIIYPTDERARYFGLDGATYVNLEGPALPHKERSTHPDSTPLLRTCSTARINILDRQLKATLSLPSIRPGTRHTKMWVGLEMTTGSNAYLNLLFLAALKALL